VTRWVAWRMPGCDRSCGVGRALTVECIPAEKNQNNAADAIRRAFALLLGFVATRAISGSAGWKESRFKDAPVDYRA
jgi:hypothetical protein